MLRVPCCDVRYDSRIKTMFGGSSLPPVCRRTHVPFTFVRVCLFGGSSLPPVCRRTHVPFTFVRVCLRIVESNSYCDVFLFCFSSSSSMLPVSLDYPFLIARSVYFSVHSHSQCLVYL
jgi:hypothetical protein